MSQRTRFCVLFTGTEEGSPVKTRLLHNDSSRDDIIQIWKQIYNEDVPVQGELIINENCVYRLDDDDDITAFLAQAEDQYKLLPTQPLRVWLGDSKQYFKSRNPTPLAVLTSTSQAPPWNGSASGPATPDKTESKSEKTVNEDSMSRRFDCSSNDDNTQHPDSERQQSPRVSAKNTTPVQQQQPLVEINPANCSNMVPDSTAWKTASSLMMLYNRYRGQNLPKPDLNSSPNCGNNANAPRTPDYKTIGGAIDSITGASMLGNPVHLSPKTRAEIPEDAQTAYANSYLAYTKHLASTLIRPPMTVPAELCKEREAPNPNDKDQAALQPKATTASLTPAYAAFMNTMQDQRAIQNNRSASYLLQNLFNNHARNLPKPAHPDPNDPPRFAVPNFLDENSSRALLNQQPNQMKSPNATQASHPFQSSRQSSLLSSLALYQNKNLLNYMYGPAVNALQNCASTDERLDDYTKKPQKKRRRVGTMGDEGKSTDSTKRMRSSISQSNIEYHYQRALDYSQMAEEEQKLQNSAHRSHWKHLLFVAKISPRFMEQFKHAKYDEWSSEARDIYAICQPDKYMWSFLTLSKQGDLLCKRMITRIDSLLKKSIEERPEWCPEDEMLHRAQSRARERLSQLQRILYSRSMTQEAKNNEKANSDIDKMSVQEKNMVLVNAYQQRQQEILENQKLLMHAAHFRQPMPQEQQRHAIPSAIPSSSQGVHCGSSLSSSPVSISSPAFEDNVSAVSGCSESPPQEERHNDANLVIAEDKESSVSPDVADDLATRDLSPLPFVTSEKCALQSPQKWSTTKIEQVADV